MPSERVVPEEEWAADLVDLLALDAALPDAPRPADYFSLLCAEQAEREVGAGRAQRADRAALRGERRGAAAAAARRSGAHGALASRRRRSTRSAVEGVGRQRWLIDQEPVGHLDPTPLGVVWSPATTPLRAGPHEITGYLGPDARAERVSLVALRSLCIAPADGWHAQRPLTYGAKARTLVRIFGFESRLPQDGDPIEIEGEAYETVSAGRRPHQSPRQGGGIPERLGDGLAEPRGADLAAASRGSRRGDARGAGAGRAAPALVGRRALPRDRGADRRSRGLRVGAGADAPARLRRPRAASAHRAPRAGVDLLRATPRRSSDADYVSVLSELGLHVSAAEALVTRSDALASLSSGVFLELAGRFQRRIEGDPAQRPVVLVDEAPEPRSADRALSPMLPSEL